MRYLVGLLLVVGCATRAPHQLTTPADSTSHGGEFTALVIAALLVLVLIPTLTPKRSP